MAKQSMEIDEIEDSHQQQKDRDYVLNGGEISASEDDNSSSVSIKNMTLGGHEFTRKCAISRLDAKNLTSTESYKLDEDFEPVRHKPSAESNIEQIPVEIAAKSNNSNSYNKQESTSVIIDTNSILSRREPVPMNHFSGSSSSGNSADSNKSGIFPMAFSAQEIYPSDMRATITPIPQTSSSTPPKLTPSTSTIASPSPSTSQTCTAGLPESTDDMFVIEPASLVVPYLYQKPPLTKLKAFKEEQNNGGGENDAMEIDDIKDDGEKVDLRNLNFDPLGDPKKSNSYFESSLGQFFIGIGFKEVQQYDKSDLQEHIKSPLKKCEYCNFKTESLVVMANHLETPHIKNKMYMCNFCPYKVLSPHDILSHMEAKHGVKGRLEEAPALHQCINCPYESKHKSRVTRHLVSCMPKFPPKFKHLKPPVDWEPPAKTPRVPMLRGRGRPKTKASPTVKDNTRGRGRPRTKASPTIEGNTMMSRASNNVHKQAMSGGSVLMSTNNQLNGNQVNQQQSQKTEMHQPSISIISLPGPSATPSANMTSNKPGDTNSNNSVATCEICDDNITDSKQLHDHMLRVHMIKLIPGDVFKCIECPSQFVTDQGIERHLLGQHGLVSRTMQEAANKNEDAGECPVCRVNQMKLLNHLERDHRMVLTPAVFSYKCRVCAARFPTHEEFEEHVFFTHSEAPKLLMAKYAGDIDGLMKLFKITRDSPEAKLFMEKLSHYLPNLLATVNPLPAKASTSKEGSPATSSGSAGTSASV